jgi:hypothetical protein
MVRVWDEACLATLESFILNSNDYIYSQLLKVLLLGSWKWRRDSSCRANCFNSIHHLVDVRYHDALLYFSGLERLVPF